MQKTFHRAIKLFSQTKIQILILIIITILSYGNILQNGISYDDKDFLLYWPTIQNSQSGLSSFLSLPDLLAGALPTNHQGVYRPVRSIYYLLSYKLWGFNPFMFHLQSIIVHLLVVLVVYNIAKILTKKTVFAFITAALFATHPVHTEAITYTAASFDSLGILFFFCSFYFYLKAGSLKKERETTYLLSWLLAFLAFFTYEMTLILPFLIIFYEVSFKKINFKNLTQRLKIYIPYIIILIGYIIIRTFLLKIGNRADYLGEDYLIASNQAKLATPQILYLYGFVLIFPFQLSVSYSFVNSLFPYFIQTMQYIDPSEKLLAYLSSVSFIIPLLFILIFMVPLYLFFRKYSLIFFSLGWLLISLIPILNVFPQGAIMAERFLYIPSFGFCLLFALFLSKISSKQTLLGILLFLIIIGAYITGTATRNGDWKDEESIFLSALKLDSKSFIANGALGTLMYDRGQFDQAIDYLKIAIESNPAAYKTRHHLGLSYERSGKIEEAKKEFKEALAYEPRFHYAISSLGNIYQREKKYDEAIAQYKKTLEIDPDFFDAYFGLGVVYTQTGEYPKALEEYSKALKLQPNSSFAYNGLGKVYEKQGDRDEAASAYKKAIELYPTNPYFYLSLANLYSDNNDLTNALLILNEALMHDPNNEDIKNRIQDLKK